MDLQVDYWLVAGNKKDINKVLLTSALSCACGSFVGERAREREFCEIP